MESDKETKTEKEEDNVSQENSNPSNVDEDTPKLDFESMQNYTQGLIDKLAESVDLKIQEAIKEFHDSNISKSYKHKPCLIILFVY